MFLTFVGSLAWSDHTDSGVASRTNLYCTKLNGHHESVTTTHGQPCSWFRVPNTYLHTCTKPTSILSGGQSVEVGDWRPRRYENRLCSVLKYGTVIAFWGNCRIALHDSLHIIINRPLLHMKRYQGTQKIVHFLKTHTISVQRLLCWKVNRRWYSHVPYIPNALHDLSMQRLLDLASTDNSKIPDPTRKCCEKSCSIEVGQQLGAQLFKV
jgi:hypothetical protein